MMMVVIIYVVVLRMMLLMVVVMMIGTVMHVNGGSSRDEDGIGAGDDEKTVAKMDGSD